MCKHSKTWRAWSKWKPCVPTTQLQKQINQYFWSPLCVHFRSHSFLLPKRWSLLWAHRSCDLWVFHSDFPPLYSRWSWWVCQSENPTPVIKVSTYFSLQEWFENEHVDWARPDAMWIWGNNAEDCAVDHLPTDGSTSHVEGYGAETGYRGKAWPR